MPRKTVQDLKTGDAVDEGFLLRSKALRTTRTNSLYMLLELGDRTGTIQGRMWDASQEVFDSISVDSFVRVKGHVETYRNQLQLVADAIAPVPDSEVDVADFLPTTNKDVDEMYARLVEIAKTVRHPGLRKLLAAFLKDDDFAARFRRAPAAVTYHHSFLGGLLEHTLGVAELGLHIAEHHPELDRDLLVTGTLLHDIGKIDEFTYERGFEYTDTGGLLGHLYMGARMIEERAADIPELSPQTTEALSHLILSHHGRYEYQSPKLPMTAEALAVHFLDNLDAKLNAFHSAMLQDRDAESRWTEWNRMFERKLFKGHDPVDED
jgi:3'-5' exoribonuclease